MKRRVILCLSLGLLLLSGSLFAQVVEVSVKPLTDEDVALLRQDLTKAKMEVIAETMQFTKPEGEAFWPVYKEYSDKQNALNAMRLEVIKEYAQAIEKIDAAKAHDLTSRLLKIDQDLISLKQNYLMNFEKAVGGTRAAKFFQVDNRLTLLVNLQLASQVPIIP